jgi:hypothetical protein
MSNPPRLAIWLLEVALPTPDGEAIAGDLVEEFSEHTVPHRGRWFARWWFCWQVARSLGPLYFRSWERASLLRASVALIGAGCVATVPAAGLLMLRTFALQQVPLKTTAEVSTLFALSWLTVLLVTASIAAVVAIRILYPRRTRKAISRR